MNDHEETTQRLAAMDAVLIGIHNELGDIQKQLDVMVEMVQTILAKIEERENG